MKLIVGLGNPGMEYQFTPHNAGFLAIDRIAEQCGAAVVNRRSKALTATARVAGQNVILAKPQTFMNLSGESVAALLREVEGDRSRDMIVLYDELALPLGSIRVRERGSSGGHNGAKSISGALGTEEWVRVRIGVGAPEGMEEESRRGRDYLLSPMGRRDLQGLDGALDEAAKAVEVILAEGVSAAMNRFNRREPVL